MRNVVRLDLFHKITTLIYFNWSQWVLHCRSVQLKNKNNYNISTEYIIFNKSVINLWCISKCSYKLNNTIPMKYAKILNIFSYTFIFSNPNKHIYIPFTS